MSITCQRHKKPAILICTDCKNVDISELFMCSLCLNEPPHNKHTMRSL